MMDRPNAPDAHCSCKTIVDITDVVTTRIKTVTPASVQMTVNKNDTQPGVRITAETGDSYYLTNADLAGADVRPGVEIVFHRSRQVLLRVDIGGVTVQNETLAQYYQRCSLAGLGF